MGIRCVNVLFLIFLIWCAVACGAGANGVRRSRVIEPVVNVTAVPGVEYRCCAPVVTPQVEAMYAQLIYNEPIICLTQTGGWCQVELPNHCVLVNRELKALTGWVPASALCEECGHDTSPAVRQGICTALWTPVYTCSSVAERWSYTYRVMIPFGARVSIVNMDSHWAELILPTGERGVIAAPHITLVDDLPKTVHAQRAWIVAQARRMIGMPYCWGGISPHQPAWSDRLSGFDCSGLVYRLYACCGLILPRNTTAQWHSVRPCDPKELQAGDLLFFSKTKAIEGAPLTMCHVLMYTGDGSLIEAWAQPVNGEYNPQPVREVSAIDRLGKPLSQLMQGDYVTGGYRCYFGSVFAAEQNKKLKGAIFVDKKP